MPLPLPVPRDDLHLRQIELRGYRRHDGLYDVEARMTDTKSHTLTLQSGRVVEAGDPIHDMWVRLVVDEHLTVVDVVAATDASPFEICPEATETLRTIVGLRIVSGWTMAIKEKLGGKKGCTHLTELLSPLATVAFQTLAPARLAQPPSLDREGRPRKIDSCYAYASERTVVLERWPAFYTGPAHPAAGAAAGAEPADAGAEPADAAAGADDAAARAAGQRPPAG